MRPTRISHYFWKNLPSILPVDLWTVYLYSFLGVRDFFIAETSQGDEAADAIIESCFHSHCLAEAVPGVKMLPNLQFSFNNNFLLIFIEAAELWSK